jgi:cytochrome c oxidase subunit 4
MSTETITPPRTFAVIFAALLVLTGTTAWVAFVDLGWFNPVIAFTIACVKMLLVALFFMEIRHSSRITKITVGAGLFWLMILLALTLSDYLTRWWPT